MGFLDYLDNLESIEPENITEKQTKSTEKSKVLSLNVEIRTPKGAKLVIEKLEDWISKQQPKKKTYRIPPKKVVKNSETKPKNKIHESISHAMDILDGLPDTPEPDLTPMNMTEQKEMQQNIIQPKPNLDSVSGHASALL